MLSLTKIKLHNICQYFDKEIEFGTGMSAVIGRNGAGKSNMCRALVYGLTGLVDPAWGYQTDLQKDGTTDPGYVELSLRNGNTTYAVRRYATKLNAGKAFQDFLDVREDGATIQAVSCRKAVNAALEELYGVSCQLLFTLCWVRQGRLDMLLTATGGFINQMLQTLFSMQRFEKLRELLHNVDGELASFPDMSAEIADISARIQSLPAPAHENTIEAMQAEVEEISRRIAELDVVRKTGMSQSRMKQALDFTEGIRTQASVWLQNNPMIPKPEDTEGYQSLADLYKDQAAESAKSTGLKQRRAMTGAAYDRSSHTREMLVTDVATLTGQFEDISHKLDEMPDVCHLCGGRIVNVEAYNNARCKMLTGEDTRDQFNDRMRNAIDSVKKRISDLDVQMDGLRQEMTKLDSDIALSDAVMEKHAELVPAVSKLEEHMAWARERDSKLEALKRADDDIARLNAMSVYPDDIDCQMAELTQRLQTVRGSIEDQVSCDNEYAVGIRSLEARKELLEAQMQKAELNGKVRRFLVGMRDLFSAGNAQAIYLNGRIDMLNRLIARYMTGAQMPFRLYLDKEEHVFKFETSDGFVHPSDHLSGAQKSMSAVALQMALLAVVSPNINVCILDEPAEALDGTNKVLMAGMLERMARMLPSVDGTMLIVTRDEQIIDSCQTVIEIEGQNI